MNIFNRKTITVKIKKCLLAIEDRFPFVGSILVKIMRYLRYFICYKPLFFINKKNKKNKIYYLDPNKIKFICGPINKKINLLTDRSLVISGNWDLSESRIEDYFIYKGIRERFVNGRDWQKTSLYDEAIKVINSGEIFNGCQNKDKLEKYFQNIDSLYKSIKDLGFFEGYKNNNFKGKSDPFIQGHDEIKISIGRNGEPLFLDGIHRLSIAKILKIKKIPVSIIACHSEWAKIEKSILNYSSRLGGTLYQPAYHFYFNDIPYSYGDERFQLIKNSLDFNSGSVLDIGANIGYFSHRLEGIGFDCCAVEINPQDIDIMRKLKKINNNKFEIIEDSIFNFKKDETLKYDVVLALYIFHHFLKRKKTYEDLVGLLNRIDCKVIFLGTHNPKESQIEGAYINYDPEEFVKFVAKNSSLSNYLLIKEFDDGRRLYKIFK